MKFRLSLSLFFLFYSWVSLHAEIKVIPEREYFNIAHEELNNAKESIEVTMFLIKLDDDSLKVKTLLEDLIEARERGVKVAVTLEDKADNKRAYEYLKEKVFIRYDSPEAKTHSKKIVIDNRKLIIGSSNWTDSAFNKNHESGVMVDLIEDKDKLLLLEGEDYLNNLMEVFKDCQKSLDIAMYLFLFKKGDFDDPVNHIIGEIVRLRQKGVKVRILLDSWEEDPGQNEGIKNLLGLDGVSVYFDHESIATHNKLIIVDGERVILGSTNWTESALKENIESSILINEVEIARSFSDYFDLLLEDIPQIDLDAQYFPLPVYFITEGSPLDWLKDRALTHSLRLYIWLIWNSFQDKSARIAIQKDKWYNNVYSGEIVKPSYIRARIDSCLKHLKQLNLIQCDGKYLLLLNPEKPDLLWSLPEEDYFSVPGKFMEYGWFKKISASALVGYFINLAEFKKSSSKPYWFDSLPKLGKRYCISGRNMSKAFQQLMEFNLIEIIHDIPDPGQFFWERKANRYLINPLYSEAEIEVRWNALEKRHGELYYKARELAASIKDPEDPDIVASFIMLQKIYGEEVVREAVAKARRYHFGSGRWEMRYIVGILKRDYKPISVMDE